MKDIHSGMNIALALAAAVLAADTTSAAIDLQGYDAAEIVLSVGAGGITFSGTNKVEFVLTHSDDDVTYTPVTLTDIIGAPAVTNGIIKALTAAHAEGKAYRFGYKGGKRYLKLMADFSGTHGTGTPISAIVIRARGYDNPQANQA
ncbi:hypothetical protein [Asticcacaulis excentricus]|uniref:Uncharacterized protein n=1 Tax=Asticcacaulis excentricus (strain ATCC 15261 / DSM 4724 / KCTC 12464 / NCIMB 9791 / VKM B-1370 / CB 48) TaxID=573065 RepID=E8RPQ3_ASTEC|nr:hypothetical protein [Asticcacaulis excentricus]ADU12030.1 hypothetical protein Astex_0332 [Asticcacaulis excentricus CB 48]